MDSTVLHLSGVWSTKGTTVPSKLPSPQCETQHECAKNEQLILLLFEHGQEGDSID